MVMSISFHFRFNWHFYIWGTASTEKYKIGCICKSCHNQICKQIILLFCHKQLCLRQAAGVLKAEYDVCRQLKMIDNIYQFTYICNLKSFLLLQVMPTGFRPSLPPGEGVFISGLRLHNALWDATRAVLMMPTPDSPPDQEIPIFWLKPLDNTTPPPTRALYKLYRCPVYCSGDMRQHGASNIVVHFSLPSHMDSSVWQHQRVFLSTKVPVVE